MLYQKVMLLFISFVFVSLLYAQEDASSLAGEAQSMADKISEVASELQGLASEAASAGDTKLKACIDGNLRAVKSLVSSANSMVSQIASLAASGKVAEAKNLLEGLGGMADNADQVLTKAQSCEGGSNQQKAADKKDSKLQNQNRPQTQAAQPQVSADGSVTMTNTADGSSNAASSSDSSTSVSDAMSLDIGSDMVTETERDVEGTDTSDAAGADMGGGLQSGSGDTSAIDEIAPETGTVADDPQDVPVPVEEEEEIEDQSPTR